MTQKYILDFLSNYKKELNKNISVTKINYLDSFKDFYRKKIEKDIIYV